MKKMLLFFSSLCLLASLQAQNVLMPGAIAHKLHLDGSSERKISLAPFPDKGFDKSMALALSAKSDSLVPDSTIIEMMNQVDTVRLRNTVQHLQDYGTRYAYLPQADSAGDWIYKKMDSINSLTVVKQYFPIGWDSAFNVIATLTGTKYPDEYVIIGAHYDSYNHNDQNDAPGAEDNGVGVAGVLEAARIMSQYTFDRSIIFACWTMEEINMGGSGYFTRQATDNNMKIFAYFNLDGGGHKPAGSQPTTYVLNRLQTDELADFYEETCSIYLPSFIIKHGRAQWSDDFGFSLNGYQGIWSANAFYAGYDHSSMDKIGITVNSFYNLGIFVKADIANLSRIADLAPRPMNLRAHPEDGKIILTWNPNDFVDHYNVYRDSILYSPAVDTSFVDNDVANGVYYSYYVTSVFSNSGNESDASYKVRVTPSPVISVEFTDDFENNGIYWYLEAPWGLENNGLDQSACLSDSPGTNYQNWSLFFAFLKPIDLIGYTESEFSFMSKYNFDTDGNAGCELFVYDNSIMLLDEFYWINNQPDWIKKSYSLNNFLGKSNVQLVLMLYCGGGQTADGIYIDNFSISSTNGITEPGMSNTANTIKVLQNPFSNRTTIEYLLEDDVSVYLSIFDYLGKEVEVIIDKNETEGKHQVEWNAEDLPAGIYYCRLQAGNHLMLGKIIKLK